MFANHVRTNTLFMVIVGWYFICVFFLLAAPRPRNYISHFPNFAAFIIIAQCAVALLLHIHFFTHKILKHLCHFF